ncbi:Hypothetical protein SMAX5B_000253, partial [Scophthalmus maximus]
MDLADPAVFQFAYQPLLGVDEAVTYLQRSFNVCSRILGMSYQSVVASALSFTV